MIRNPYAEASKYFAEKGWSQLAAQAIVTFLGATPETIVPPRRWGMFCDWASAHERNPEYNSAAWAFIDYELRNSFHGIGRELNKATTVTEAHDALRDYFFTKGN